MNLIAVGRCRERLEELVGEFPHVRVQTVAADLSTSDGIQAVITAVGHQPVTLLVNNAGVAHYKAFIDLNREQVSSSV